MVASVAGNGKSPQQVMLREQVRAMILDAIRQELGKATVVMAASSGA